MVEQINAPELKGKIPVHAFLSYRQKIPAHANVIKPLEACCITHSIKLVYDQSGIENGESIIAFMHEDLGTARCVFILLSPEYFQSAYTLFELVSIHERGNFDKRFILLIRVSKNMSAYEWTAAEKFWWDDNNKAIRDELVRLLTKVGFLKDDDDGAAWEKVKAAWTEIIFPHLDHLNPALEFSLDKSDIDKILNECMTAVWNAIRDTLEEEKNLLHGKVESEIEKTLRNEGNFIPLDRLAREIGLEVGVSAESIAKHLVKNCKVEDAIASLTRLVEEKRDKLMPSKPEQWEECHYNAEQLGGWLLINSVDPVWWFNHQLKMKRAIGESALCMYPLSYPPYIEVIISRSALQGARYKLDAEGKVQPTNGDHDVMLFDGVSSDATDIQLLAPIYKDLHRGSVEYPFKLEELLKAIFIRAKARHKAQGKPVYYLVKQATLTLLEGRPWFVDASKQLAPYFQIIYCEVVPKNYDQSPCDDQEFLLEQIAYLLSLR